MRRHGLMMRVVGVVAAAAVGVAVSASASPAGQGLAWIHGRPAAARQIVTLLMGTAPDSLDPGFAYTTQAAEPDWLSCLGLDTYAHASGTAGTALIPALATSLPKVTNGGKTYTVTLRRGLVYSNGASVRASDFLWTVERDLKIPWGGSAQFLTPRIRGAAAYASGRAKTISGISTNDATGQITIQLVAPYGAFDNVLAFPSLGLVPGGTPLLSKPSDPPPGVGPYVIEKIVPDQSFSLLANPYWAQMQIPRVPAGSVDVNVTISPDTYANAQAVLSNTVDVFDWADTIPGGLLAQIKAQAPGRYSRRVMNSTYFTFFNTRERPFSSQLAREAVVTALNENALNRLGSDSLITGCYFLPPNMIGHPSTPCPYGNPSAGGNLARARVMLKRSGMTGTLVTVWSQTRSPRRQWMNAYAQLLRRLGFRVRQRVVADARYFDAVDRLSDHAQTGFYDWNQDFPNPADFYQLLDGRSIGRYYTQNPSLVNDPKIQRTLTTLECLPANRLQSTASRWQALERYVAQKAYLAVFGYQTFPAFTSNRIDYQSIVFHPMYGWDWSSFHAK